MSSNSPFIDKFFNVPLSDCKDNINALEEIDFNGLCICSNLHPDSWSSEVTTTLTKIVSLINLDLHQSLMLQYSSPNVLNDILALPSVKTVFLFVNDIDPLNYNFNLHRNQWMEINGKSVFISEDLDAFIVNNTSKGMLWKALQAKFEAAKNFSK